MAPSHATLQSDNPLPQSDPYRASLQLLPAGMESWLGLLLSYLSPRVSAKMQGSSLNTFTVEP